MVSKLNNSKNFTKLNTGKNFTYYDVIIDYGIIMYF